MRVEHANTDRATARLVCLNAACSANAGQAVPQEVTVPLADLAILTDHRGETVVVGAPACPLCEGSLYDPDVPRDAAWIEAARILWGNGDRRGTFES